MIEPLAAPADYSLKQARDLAPGDVVRCVHWDRTVACEEWLVLANYWRTDQSRNLLLFPFVGQGSLWEYPAGGATAWEVLCPCP